MIEEPKCFHRRTKILTLTSHIFHRFLKFRILNWVKKESLFDEVCDKVSSED